MRNAPQLKRAALLTAVAIVGGSIAGLAGSAGTASAEADPFSVTLASVFGDSSVQVALSKAPNPTCSYRMHWGDKTSSVLADEKDVLRHHYGAPGAYHVSFEQQCGGENTSIGTALSASYEGTANISRSAGPARTEIVASALPASPSEYFFLQSGSEQVLGGVGTSPNGAQPTLANRDFSRLDQQWKFAADGLGGYQLLNRQTGQALDVFGASFRAGEKAILWTPQGSPNQSWSVRSAHGGFQLITAGASHMVLDVNGTTSGAIQSVLTLPTGYFWDGTATSTWKLVPAP